MTTRHLAVPAMLLYVVMNSASTLAITAVGGRTSPFIVNLLFRTGMLIVYLVYTLIAAPSPQTREALKTALRQKLRSAATSRNWLSLTHMALPIAVIGNFDDAVFAIAARHADVTVATVIYQTWPVFYILFTVRLMPAPPQGAALPALVAVSIVGAALAHISQVQHALPTQHLLAITGEEAAGAALALLAAALGGLPAFALRWGVDLANQTTENLRQPEPSQSLQFYCVIATALTGVVIHLPAGIAAAALAADPGITPAQASAAWMSGALCIGLPALLWRWANLAAPDQPGINAAGFLTPAFSVAWLLLFLKDASVAHWPTFAAGTLLVALANMVLALRTKTPAPAPPTGATAP